MELPSIHEIMPMVEFYITTFNSGLPLFHGKTLLDMVNAWYCDPHSRDLVAWAAISVVLAISSDLEGSYNSTTATARYINNAQSVVTSIITGQLSLLNVQVLVGMTLFFIGRHDWQPAGILIASALRLARQLRLHTRRSSEHLDPVMAAQRTYVFWIAYILDKDISMRTKQPSIQTDWDINLEMPRSGEISKADALVDFFRARVELAVIEGRIYDDLYSEHSQLLSASERSETICNLLSCLDNWHRQLPPEFERQRLAEVSCSGLSRWFGVLHSTGLVCLALVSRAHSIGVTQGGENSQDYGKRTAMRRPESLFPPGWKAVVNAARDMMCFYKMSDVSLIW